MVAWAGLERHQLGMHDDLGLCARPRWPLAQKSLLNSLIDG